MKLFEIQNQNWLEFVLFLENWPLDGFLIFIFTISNEELLLKPKTANRAESGQLQFWSKPSEILNLRSRNCSLQYTLIPWSLTKCDAPYYTYISDIWPKSRSSYLKFVFAICIYLNNTYPPKRFYSTLLKTQQPIHQHLVMIIL